MKKKVPYYLNVGKIGVPNKQYELFKYSFDFFIENIWKGRKALIPGVNAINKRKPYLSK